MKNSHWFVTDSHWFVKTSPWILKNSHWFVKNSHWFVTGSHWFVKDSRPFQRSPPSALAAIIHPVGPHLTLFDNPRASKRSTCRVLTAGCSFPVGHDMFPERCFSAANNPVHTPRCAIVSLWFPRSHSNKGELNSDSLPEAPEERDPETNAGPNDRPLRTGAPVGTRARPSPHLPLEVQSRSGRCIPHLVDFLFQFCLPLLSEAGPLLSVTGFPMIREMVASGEGNEGASPGSRESRSSTNCIAISE